MTELKPCPFCGEEAEFVLEGSIVGRIRCKCCRVTQTFLRPIGNAIEIWNRRTADGWQEILQKGFQECMRVLKPNGVLIFKWNEVEVPISKILHLFGKQPLFGHASGKRMNTHWVCFMKEA